MIRILACVLALLAAAPAAAQTLASLSPAQQNARPALRADAIVTDDVVRIGDLIDNAGIIANIPIFQSPDPGTTGRVPAAKVIAAVEAHALIGLSANGIREVRVTRPGRQLAARDMETQIAAALASRYALGGETDIEVRFDTVPQAIAIDAEADGRLNVEQLSYLPRSGRFEAVVAIGGGRQRVLRLTGTARATAEVVTLARALSRGAIVRESDITIERQPRSQVTPDMLVKANDAVGRALRNPVGPGRPLRASDLTQPQLVARNEVVTIVYEVPGITLTARGKANESGAEGEVIEVLNAQSKRAVHGVVAGPGRVVVTAFNAGAAIAANAGHVRKSTSAAIRAQ